MAGVAEEIDALRGTRPATLKDLLTAPAYSRLWRAMLVSSLGDWVGFVAVAALVVEPRFGGGRRLGGLAVAGVMLSRLLPSVLFGPFAGVFADRFDRRKVMVGADIGRGIGYASMPFLPGLPWIFLMSFLVECLSLLWTPAKDASVPNLVPRRQLANANSVGLVTTYGTLPLGGALYTALAGAGVALGKHVHYFSSRPEFLALWLDAFTFAFSARMIWKLDLRQNAVARIRVATATKLSLRSLGNDVRDGFRFLREHALVRTMTIGIAVAFAGVGAVISLGPVFAKFELSAGSEGFGILVVAFGVGMGAGLGTMNFLVRYIEKENLFSLAMLGAAGSLFVLAAMPTIGLAALFTVPMGMGVGLTWVTGYTMLQENVTDEFRGRTFATLTVLARMTLFLALVVFPALSFAIGPHPSRSGGTSSPGPGSRCTSAVWWWSPRPDSPGEAFAGAGSPSFARSP